MNKQSSFFILTLIFSFFQINDASSQVMKLSLQDAVAVAQSQSPLAEALRNNRRSAMFRYQAFRSGLLPNLSLSGDAPSYINSINPITQPDGTVQFLGQEQSTISTSLDVSQQIPYTGGRFELSSGINRIFFYNAATNTWQNSWQSTPLVLSYIQPVLQFNQLAWDLKLEPIRDELSNLQFTESMEEVALNTTRSYFNAYLAKINLENARLNVAFNDTTYKISKGRFNVGKIAENELLQTELAYLNAQTDLQNAELSYEKALLGLKIQLGIPVQRDIEIDSPEALELMDLDTEQAISLAKKNSSFLTDIKLREMEAERNLDQAKSQTGFNGTLTARYGLNQTSAELSDVYSNLQARSFFTVGFQIPILNWGQNKERVQSAQEAAKSTKNRVSVDREQFLVDTEFRVRQFLLQQKQFEIAIKSDNIAQRRYNVTRSRYAIGKVDITNLLIAQSEKDQARTGLIRAQRDYWLAWYELRRTTLYDFIENKPIQYDLF